MTDGIFRMQSNRLAISLFSKAQLSSRNHLGRFSALGRAGPGDRRTGFHCLRMAPLGCDSLTEMMHQPRITRMMFKPFAQAGLRLIESFGFHQGDAKRIPARQKTWFDLTGALRHLHRCVELTGTTQSN